MILNLKPFEVDIIADLLDAAIYECEKHLKLYQDCEPVKDETWENRKDALWVIVHKLPEMKKNGRRGSQHP